MFRIAVTTSRDRTEALAAEIRRSGLSPVPLPCIEVSPAAVSVLADAREEAKQADWLLVTSSRAVATLWPNGGMPQVSVAAVGRSTADAADRAGGRVALVGEAGARHLVKELAGQVSQRTLLFPHASGADMSTVESLREAGANVVAIPVYHTRPIAPGPDPVDGAIYGSPSAVTGWCLSRDLDDLVVGAIGETTTKELLDRDCTPDIVPPQPDFGTLVAMMADHLRDRSPV